MDTSSYVGGSSEGIVLLESGSLAMSEYGGGLTMMGCSMISSTGLLVAVGGSTKSQVQLAVDSPVNMTEVTSHINFRQKQLILF